MEQNFQNSNLGSNNVTIGPSGEQSFADMVANNVQAPVNDTVNSVNGIQTSTQTTSVAYTAAQYQPTSAPVATSVSTSSGLAYNPVGADNIQTSNENITTQAPAEPTISSKYTITASKLKKIIKTIKLAAINDSNIPLSKLIELEFSQEGLLARGTDYVCKISYIDRSVKYSANLRIAVEIDIFSSLINTLDDDAVVEIVPNATGQVLTILADDGEFVFQQRNDESGNPISIPEICGKATTDSIKVDFSELQAKIVRAHEYMAKEKTNPSLACIYMKDRVIACDGDNGFAEPALPEISNYTVLISPKSINALTTITFENDVYISFELDELGAKSIHLSDGIIDFECLAYDRRDEFSANAITSVIDLPYDHYITFNKAKLEDVLSRAILFLDSNRQNDAAQLTLKNNVLNVTTRNNLAKQNYYVSGNITEFDTMLIDIRRLYTALTLSPKDDVVIGIKEGSFICLVVDDIKQMMSVKD